MPDWQLTTPVAFIIFNRPDTTARVFAEIARAKPPQLLVIADGARSDRPGEAELCAATRAIIEGVDWDCEVKTNFADRNMGCRQRVSSGLDWVFDTVEAAIILEDDCLPEPGFFRFCEELLEKYRDDERIGQISGDNFQFGHRHSADSYYFSRFNHIWGWATWRRAWKNYDVSMAAWPQARDRGWLREILDDKHQASYWGRLFQRVADGEIDTWDYQWVFACWRNNALTILPNVNLVSNIGFGPAATHTTRDSQFANMETETMQFPLRHPDSVIRDTQADLATTGRMFNTSLAARALNGLKRVARR
jgi:hypothetical protein